MSYNSASNIFTNKYNFFIFLCLYPFLGMENRKYTRYETKISATSYVLEKNELQTLLPLSEKEFNLYIKQLKESGYIKEQGGNIILVSKPSKANIESAFKNFDFEDNITPILYAFYSKNKRKFYSLLYNAIEIFKKEISEESRIIFKIIHMLYIRYKPNINDKDECKNYIEIGSQLIDIITGMAWNFSRRCVLHHKLLAITRVLGDKRSELTIYARLGILTVNGETEYDNTSFKILEKAVQQIIEFDDTDILIQNMYAISHYYYAKGNFYKALNFIFFYTVIPRDIIPLTYSPWIYTRSAFAALFLGQLNKSIKIMNKALELAYSSKNQNYINYCQDFIAYIYISQNNLDKAFSILKTILEKNEKEKDHSYGLIRAKRIMAFCLYKKGELKKSHELYLETIKNIDGTKFVLHEYSGMPFLVELFNAYDSAAYKSFTKFTYAQEVENALNSSMIGQKIIAHRCMAQRLSESSWNNPQIKKHLDIAIHLCDKTGAILEKHKTLILMARQCLHLGKIEEGLAPLSKIILNNIQYYEEWHEDLDILKDKLVKHNLQPNWNEDSYFLKTFINNLLTIKSVQLSLNNQKLPYHNMLNILMNTYGAMQGAVFLRSTTDKANILNSKIENIVLADVAIDAKNNFEDNEIILKCLTQKEYIVEKKEINNKDNSIETQTKIAFYIQNNLGEYIFYISYLNANSRYNYEEEKYIKIILKFISNEIEEYFKLKNYWEQQIVQIPKNTVALQELSPFLHQSTVIKKLLEQVEQLATADTPTLIRGESGVGKELIAKRLHEQSNRKGYFIPVNITSIPEELFESELFGHEKGSFTGAHAQKKGLLELANNGTLFIDEIGDLSFKIQVKLLRVLQEKQFMRVGGTQFIKCNFRLITATHVDLEKAIANGQFRQDLFYRINVIPLNIPPLRERKEDISFIAKFYLDYYSKEHNKKLRILSEEDTKVIENYPWHGNVRELKNYCERLILLPRLSFTDLLKLSSENIINNNEISVAIELSNSEKEETISNNPIKIIPIKEYQDIYFEQVYIQKNGIVAGKNGIATALGISINTAHTWVAKLGLKNKYTLKIEKIQND